MAENAGPNHGYTVGRITDPGDEQLPDSPVRVAVTGAAGQIGYALLFRIARKPFLAHPAAHADRLHRILAQRRRELGLAA